MPRPPRALQFLLHTLTLETDECIIWPFCKDQIGYGMINWRRGNTKMRRAHNLACELAHGSAPPGQETAHSCRQRACINKRHLRWDTRKGNYADQITHGTRVLPTHAKLTLQQIGMIRRSKEPTTALARRLGVSYSCIWDLRNGRSWQKPALLLEHPEHDGVAPPF